MRSLLIGFAVFMSTALLAQNGIFGRWVTIDDNPGSETGAGSGKKRSIVEITERSGKAYGRIAQLFREPGEEADPICDECDPTDDRHNKKVIDMEFIRDMVKDPSTSSGQAEWEAGTILDPENGKVYDCKLWVEEGKLKVRGYVAFFSRTQTWVRE